MFSNRLTVERNAIYRNRGPRTHGMLLRDCSDGEFTDNRLVDNTVALFLDGSNRNRFERNLIQDNGWGVSTLGPLISFASSGVQTLRIQAREDGFRIDQIVLSPLNYLILSPGLLKNDRTILPRPVAPPPQSPATPG